MTVKQKWPDYHPFSTIYLSNAYPSWPVQLLPHRSSAPLRHFNTLCIICSHFNLDVSPSLLPTSAVLTFCLSTIGQWTLLCNQYCLLTYFLVFQQNKKVCSCLTLLFKIIWSNSLSFWLAIVMGITNRWSGEKSSNGVNRPLRCHLNPIMSEHYRVAQRNFHPNNINSYPQKHKFLTTNLHFHL